MLFGDCSAASSLRIRLRSLLGGATDEKGRRDNISKTLQNYINGIYCSCEKISGPQTRLADSKFGTQLSSEMPLGLKHGWQAKIHKQRRVFVLIVVQSAPHAMLRGLLCCNPYLAQVRIVAAAANRGVPEAQRWRSAPLGSAPNISVTNHKKTCCLEHPITCTPKQKKDNLPTFSMNIRRHAAEGSEQCHC